MTADGAGSVDVEGAVVCCATDSVFVPYVRDLLMSLRLHFDAQSLPVHVLTIDITVGEARSLTDLGAVVRRLDTAPPHPAAAKLPVSVAANWIRPRLPDAVPGEVLIWIDADAWLQTTDTLARLIRAARDGHFAAVREGERDDGVLGADGALRSAVEWRTNAYRLAGLDTAEAARLAARPMLNSGVFAAHRDAPHWALWWKALLRAMDRSANFFSEQCALNIAARDPAFPVVELPMIDNWLVTVREPAWDPSRDLLVDPKAGNALGIVHLAGPDKPVSLMLDSLCGGQVVRPVRFRGVQAERHKVQEAVRIDSQKGLNTP